MSARETTAIILAAGVAHRLAPLTDHTQKCLLEVGGRPILAWMLDALRAAGVTRTAIVVGHCADQVVALTRSMPPVPAPPTRPAPSEMAIECLHNPDYRKGSAVSLARARHLIAGGPTLIMDADVVFPREFLRRLLAAPAPNALLVDGGFADTGEEVKIYAKAGRVIALGKKVVPETWDGVGEGIGFFKCGAEAGVELVELLDQVIEASDGACEYEDALHLLVGRQPVQGVDVTGLPWTEIDFAEDLRRARLEVLPEIARREGHERA